MAFWIHKRRFLDRDIFWNNRNFNQKSFQPVLFVGGFVSAVYWSNDGDDKQNNCVYILCCIHTILWGSVTNQVCRVAWKESHFWDICDPPKRRQVSTNCSPNPSGTLNSTHWTWSASLPILIIQLYSVIVAQERIGLTKWGPCCSKGGQGYPQDKSLSSG